MKGPLVKAELVKRETMKRNLTMVWLAIGVLVVGACGGAKPASDGSRDVTVMLDWTPNTNHAGMYLAEAKGWYRDAGLNVKIIQPGEGGSLQSLGTGKADFAVSTQEEVIPARANAVPVVAVASIIQHNTSSLISLASEGITRPRDLMGKRYGGFGGPLERALVESLVKCDGGDPAAVQFVEVGNVDYAVGLTRDRFDFAWVFDGWDVIRLRDAEHLDLARIPFADHTDCIPDWYTPLIATNEKMIAKSPKTVTAFLAATRRGYELAMESPDEAASTLLKAAPELDQSLVKASAAYLAGRYAADPKEWGRQQEETWTRFAAFLTTAGLVKGKVDVGSAFTNEFLSG
jgi:ABC-type nitrate/sulfonate/bicarbonate transport system substrate-binding protein